MPIELKTARGLYALALAKEPVVAPDGTVLILSLERRDGIERVAFQCRIASNLNEPLTPDDILMKLAPWLEREFEMTRENALKSIRSERKLLEIVFDASRRGPF